MTKLQEQILQAIKNSSVNTVLNTNQFGTSIAELEVSKVAEKVCLEWIEKAFEAGGGGKDWTGEDWITRTNFQEWLKENL